MWDTVLQLVLELICKIKYVYDLICAEIEHFK